MYNTYPDKKACLFSAASTIAATACKRNFWKLLGYAHSPLRREDFGKPIGSFPPMDSKRIPVKAR